MVIMVFWCDSDVVVNADFGKTDWRIKRIWRHNISHAVCEPLNYWLFVQLTLHLHLLKPCTFCSLQFENTRCHLALKQESADEDLSQLPPAPTLLPAASPLPGSPPPPPHHLRSSSSVGRSLPPPPPAPAAKSATPSPLTTTLPPPSSGIPPTLLKGLNPS